MRDRFRQAATISSHKPLAEFEADIKPLIVRLEKARAEMLVPPDWCFKLARRKHQAGHYRHDYDDGVQRALNASTAAVPLPQHNSAVRLPRAGAEQREQCAAAIKRDAAHSTQDGIAATTPTR